MFVLCLCTLLHYAFFLLSIVYKKEVKTKNNIYIYICYTFDEQFRSLAVAYSLLDSAVYSCYLCLFFLYVFLFIFVYSVLLLLCVCILFLYNGEFKKYKRKEISTNNSARSQLLTLCLTQLCTLLFLFLLVYIFVLVLVYYLLYYCHSALYACLLGKNENL